MVDFDSITGQPANSDGMHMRQVNSPNQTKIMSLESLLVCQACVEHAHGMLSSTLLAATLAELEAAIEAERKFREENNPTKE